MRMTEESPYQLYWGKAGDAADGVVYHALVYHCLDVATVGYTYLSAYDALRRRLAAIAGITELHLLALCTWLLSLHDIGKFSWRFQWMRPGRASRFYEHEYPVQEGVSHTALGQLLWDTELWPLAWEEDWLGLSATSESEARWSRLVGRIVGSFTGHHGRPPEPGAAMSHDFAPRDLQAAKCFASASARLLLPKSLCLGQYNTRSLKDDFSRASWQLAGLTVMCDWIGSAIDPEHYTDQPLELAEYWNTLALPRSKQSVERAGILPQRPTAALSVRDLFSHIEHPSPLQHHAEKMHIGGDPQLLLIEDVTGAGKTEAALLIAKKLLAAGGAEGIYVGLPTMATANAMYERLASYFEHIFPAGNNASLVLAHSARNMSDRFMASVIRDDHTKVTGTEENGGARCGAWLADHRKKALLAHVGVGTIDQALLSILPSRHQCLRLLGLLNKVLIVDEVHSFDEYTNALLRRLITFHTAFGGSTVLLSATLSKRDRERFIDAYSTGLGETVRRPTDGKYPAVLQCTRSNVRRTQTGTRPELVRHVDIGFVHEVDQGVERIVQWAQSGRCVCWIRNTVSDAVEGYHLLLERIPSDKLILFHARFILGDRLDIERRVLGMFGKDGDVEQRRGAVLVATQVVEQSLDLDFDEMLTDLAPIDLVIQRAGRVHRHRRTGVGAPAAPGKPDQRGTPCVTLLAPPFSTSPARDWYQSMFAGGSCIYPDHGKLWLTQKVLMERGGWQQPHQLPELIESVYGEDAEQIPQELLEWQCKAEGERSAQGFMGAINALDVDSGYRKTPETWLEDTVTPTRLGQRNVTLRLAEFLDKGFRPLCPANRHPWQMSELSVSDAVFREPAVPHEMRSSLELLVHGMADKARWCTVVPVIQLEEGVWLARGKDSSNADVQLRYSRKTGGSILSGV